MICQCGQQMRTTIETSYNLEKTRLDYFTIHYCISCGIKFYKHLKKWDKEWLFPYSPFVLCKCGERMIKEDTTAEYGGVQVPYPYDYSYYRCITCGRKYIHEENKWMEKHQKPNIPTNTKDVYIEDIPF